MMDRTKWNQRTPTSWIAVTALLVFACFWVACGGGAGSANSSSWEKAITPPKLTGISPASGPTTGGTTVAVTGTDFQQGATVVFGDVPAAKINSVTSTSIEAMTPVHDPGKVDVKITNPDTRSDTLLGAFTFEGSPLNTGGPAPTVNSVLPNSGPVVGGTVVTITGTDFQSGATVTFGQTPAAVDFNNATHLQATTPAHFPGPVDVIVRNPDTQSARVPGGFTYQPVPAPTIISLLPTSGPEAGGTLVTVWGTNFLAGATVSFGGVAAASVTVTSATQLGAVTPPHAAGVVDVRVTNLDDQFATLVAGFTYGTPPPTITSVSPNSGTIAGGTSVTITGTGFQPGVPGTTVTFDAVAATGVNVISATQIQVVTPAHEAGAVDVKVTNPDAQSATPPGRYTYVTSPIITGLSVDSGLSAGGTPVTITGSNFAGGATVTFGTLPAASVNVVSTTQINVTTPAQPAGTTVSIIVTNPDTQFDTLANAFRYGQLLFSDGFESGDFSAWANAGSLVPPNYTVNADPAFVHSGSHSGCIYYNICGDPQWSPVLQYTAGGSLPGRTYYVKHSYSNATGETSSSSWSADLEANIAVPANNLLVVKAPRTMTETTGWNVYASSISGTESLQNTSPVTPGVDWTEPVGGLTTTERPSSPGTPVWSAISGGSYPVPRGYFVSITYTYGSSSEGGLSRQLSNQTVVVHANELLRVFSPPAAGNATGWNLYVGTSTQGSYRQNSSLIPLGTDWTEPATCPGSCFTNTGILNTGTAVINIGNTACPSGHQDRNRYFEAQVNPPTGYEHLFVRGYVYVKSPESDGTKGIQRKLWFLAANTFSDFGPFLKLQNGPAGDLLLEFVTQCGSPADCTQVAYRASIGSLEFDRWYAIENEVWLNTPGLSDGVVRVWVDGSLVISSTTVNIRGSKTTRIARVQPGRQVDRAQFLPVDEYRYWDDVIVADAYIGP